MKALNSLPAVRHMFPGPRMTALGALIFVAMIGMLVLFGRIQDPDVPLLFLQVAVWLAGLWWPLLATQLCLLIYHMVPLRLPGTGRTLWRGVLLHLVLSIGLPLLALCAWLPAGVDALALAAALWLGSATGLLMVSLPMAFPLVPLCIIVADGALVASPAWCGLLGALALGLSGLAWRWQLRHARSVLWMPAGLVLGGSPLNLLRLIQQLPGAQQRMPGWTRRARPAVDMAGRDLLAAVLGPTCQTLRQLRGRRGRWLVYLVISAVVLALLVGAAIHPPQPGREGMFLATIIVTLLLQVARPTWRLEVLQRPGLAELAELRLTPGMPGLAQLPVVLMRQMLCCLGERLALVALALAAAARLAYAIPPLWLWWWAGLTGLVLLQGLATAWLTLLGRHRNWWWLATVILAIVLAVGTNVHLLAHGRPLDAGWLMAWAAWAALTGVVFLALSRAGAEEIPGLEHRPARRW